MLDDYARKNLESAIVRAKDGEHVPVAAQSSAQREELRELLRNERRAKRSKDDEWTFRVGNGSVILGLLPGAK